MLQRILSTWRSLRRRLPRPSGPAGRSRRRLEDRLAQLERGAARLAVRSHSRLLAPDAPPAGDGFHDRELALHSQNGEDGLLLHLLSTVQARTFRVVEFGVEDGRECLARVFLEHFGWGGLLMDSDAACVEAARRFYHGELGIDPARLAVEQCTVTAENIDATLAAAGIEGEVDLLSIDIDGNDYWVWKAIRAVSPRVVAIEYNASFGPEEDATIPYDPAFERKAAHRSGWYHGASLAALARLGADLGYALVGCDSSGVNAFFVRRDLMARGLAEVTAQEAWRPHRSRIRRATPAQQLALLRSLPLVRDDA